MNFLGKKLVGQFQGRSSTISPIAPNCDYHATQTNQRGQSVRAFNPLSDEHQRIFKALLSGDNTINRFRNRDVRERLPDTPFLRTCGKDMRKRRRKSRGCSLGCPCN